MNNIYLKYVVLLLITSVSLQLYSQRPSHEQIHSLKIAFITEKLQLSSEEAQRFWPVYNEHKLKMRKIKTAQKEVFATISIDSLSLTKNQANNKVKSLITFENEEATLKKEFLDNLRSVLPPEKVLQLLKVEVEFHRKLIKQLKNKNHKK